MGPRRLVTTLYKTNLLPLLLLHHLQRTFIALSTILYPSEFSRVLYYCFTFNSSWSFLQRWRELRVCRHIPSSSSSTHLLQSIHDILNMLHVKTSIITECIAFCSLACPLRQFEKISQAIFSPLSSQTSILPQHNA